MGDTRQVRVYRLVIDEPPTELAAECWRCNRILDDADREELAREGALWCEDCEANLTPANSVGRRRNYLSRSAADRHAYRLTQTGGKVRVLVSDPVVFV